MLIPSKFPNGFGDGIKMSIFAIFKQKWPFFGLFKPF